MKTTFIFVFGILLISFSGCNQLPFVEKTYTITALCDSNGVITPSSVIASKGETVKFTIAPFEGYIVKDITVDGKPVTVPNDNILYLSNISSDHKVKVIIEKGIEYYTLLVSGDSGLTISPSGEKVTPKGQSVNLAIVAVIGNFIDSIYVDGVGTKMPYATTKLDYKFVANDALNHTFRATSRKMGSATITSSSSADGTVAPSGTFSVLESSQKTFTAMEKEFCSLKKWIVDGVDVNPSPTYTFHVTDTLHHTVIGDFVRDPEWYFSKKAFVRDSVYDDNYVFYYEPNYETLNFSLDGNCTRTWVGQVYIRAWSLNKSVIPIVLTLGLYSYNIELLNEKNMVLSSSVSSRVFYHTVPK